MALGSIFRGLFGSRSEEGRAEPAAEATEYKGYMIHPAPRRQQGGWLTAGRITKSFPDGVKQHEFIRADTSANRDDAIAFSVQKAMLIIDEQGDRMFGGG